jgi:hypothetical protein
LPNLNRMRHQGFHKSMDCLLLLTENRQFHKFIIITMILLFKHDGHREQQSNEPRQGVSLTGCKISTAPLLLPRELKRFYPSHDSGLMGLK